MKKLLHLRLLGFVALAVLAAACARKHSLADIKTGAEKGLAEDQFALGVAYFKGEGVPQDYAQAAQWYRKAAVQRHVKAQANFASLCYLGKGVQQDFTAALHWYREAAAQGNAHAMYNVAVMTSHGQGTAPDEKEALVWYRKAAEAGQVQAQLRLGDMISAMHGTEKDIAEAAQWLRKAAEQGNAQAQNSLGVCYEKGMGMPADHDKALDLYHKAALQGEPRAQMNLGLMYRASGNYAEALYWLLLGAQQGELMALKQKQALLDSGKITPSQAEEIGRRAKAFQPTRAGGGQ